MKHVSIFGPLALLACACAPSMAWAVTCTDNNNPNLVKNPGFESGTTGSITDWTLRFNSSADTESGVTTDVERSGKQSFYVGTERGENRLSQIVTGTVAGKVYTVCFWLEASGAEPGETASFKAQWNNADGVMVTNSLNTPWVYYSFNVVATGNDTISFEGRNDQNFYYLDNVSVQACTSCTTTPSAFRPKRVGFPQFTNH